MKRMGWALVACMLTAGCIVTSADESAPAANGADPGANASAFSRETVVHPELGRGEPSLGVAPDGTLFTVGGEFAPFAGQDTPVDVFLHVLRSTDDGHTWHDMGRPVDPMPDLDPHIVVDKDGTVWASSLTVACSSVAVSRDLGASWATNHAVCPAPGGDRHWVIPTEGGEAYWYWHDLPTFYTMAMKTTDYGRTWLPTGPVEVPDHFLLVNGGTGWGGGGFWNEATGSVFLTFTWFHNGYVLPPGGPTDRHGEPGFAVTRNGGLTWETGTIAERWGRYIGLGLVHGAADDAGNVYVAWIERQGDDLALWFAKSADDGRTWSVPARIGGGPLSPSKAFPTVAATGDGRVAVAWYQAGNHAGHPDEVPHDTTWNVTLRWTHDAMADTPTWNAGQLNVGQVKTGRICPADCDNDREFLDYFDIEILDDGRVAGVWTSLQHVRGAVTNVFGVTNEPILAAP